MPRSVFCIDINTTVARKGSKQYVTIQTVIYHTKNKLFLETASYFDKQEIILINSEYFWQTVNNFGKQQVILRNSKLFWQTASYFDKQQVILTNSK